MGNARLQETVGSIEALMTRLETELGQQRPQKKGESSEMFFASNELQRKTWRAYHGLHRQVRGGYQDPSGQCDKFAHNRRCPWLDADEKGELDTGAARTLDCCVAR